MKNFLEKKWIGPLILFLFSLGMALFLSYKISPELKEIFPVITQEARSFLPITIQDGKVTQPKDAFIQKTYTEQNETFNIVLDTRTDRLDLNTLTQNGVYLSKECIYIVSSEKTEIRCLSPKLASEPFVITEELVKDLVDKADKYLPSCLAVFFFIMFFMGSYLIILFYTVIMHWLIALLVKTTFGQTLFINTLIFVVLGLLEMLFFLRISFWVTLVLLICSNIIICKIANRKGEDFSQF